MIHARVCLQVLLIALYTCNALPCCCHKRKHNLSGSTVLHPRFASEMSQDGQSFNVRTSRASPAAAHHLYDTASFVSHHGHSKEESSQLSNPDKQSVNSDLESFIPQQTMNSSRNSLNNLEKDFQTVKNDTKESTPTNVVHELTLLSLGKEKLHLNLSYDGANDMVLLHEVNWPAPLHTIPHDLFPPTEDNKDRDDAQNPSDKKEETLKPNVEILPYVNSEFSEIFPDELPNPQNQTLRNNMNSINDNNAKLSFKGPLEPSADMAK